MQTVQQPPFPRPSVDPSRRHVVEFPAGRVLPAVWPVVQKGKQGHDAQADWAGAGAEFALRGLRGEF